MATRETGPNGFQTELLDAFKAEKIRAFHISEKFSSGIVDIYAKPIGWPVCWIELKFNTSVGQMIDLSALQRRFLKEEQEAGNYSAWCVCVQIERGKVWEMYAGTNPYQTHVQPSNLVQTRRIGQQWDVKRLLRHISADCETS